MRSGLAPCGPQDPAGAIALYGAAYATGGYRSAASRSGGEENYHPVCVQRSPLRVDTPDLGGAHGPAYADRRARPFRRRAARIDRPALVRMRKRNPWRFARRRTLG
jgi:hypothetical protein